MFSFAIPHPIVLGPFNTADVRLGIVLTVDETQVADDVATHPTPVAIETLIPDSSGYVSIYGVREITEQYMRANGLPFVYMRILSYGSTSGVATLPAWADSDTYSVFYARQTVPAFTNAYLPVRHIHLVPDVPVILPFRTPGDDFRLIFTASVRQADQTITTANATITIDPEEELPDGIHEMPGGYYTFIASYDELTEILDLTDTDTILSLNISTQRIAETEQPVNPLATFHYLQHQRVEVFAYRNLYNQWEFLCLPATLAQETESDHETALLYDTEVAYNATHRDTFTLQTDTLPLTEMQRFADFLRSDTICYLGSAFDTGQHTSSLDVTAEEDGGNVYINADTKQILLTDHDSNINTFTAGTERSVKFSFQFASRREPFLPITTAPVTATLTMLDDNNQGSTGVLDLLV